MADMAARGLVQRLDPRPHELRGQPAQHPREPHDDVGSGGPGHRARANCEQGQPNPGLTSSSFPAGGPHPLSRADMVLVVGQEYRPPFYGHVFMFGLEDHLISPFTTGYEGTAIESLYPTNTDMFRKAREAGRDRRLRTRVQRRRGSSGRRSRWRQGLCRRRGSRDHGRRRMVERGERRVLPLVCDAQQRAARHGNRRRGLDQQFAEEQARRLAAARTSIRARAGSRCTRGSKDFA